MKKLFGAIAIGTMFCSAPFQEPASQPAPPHAIFLKFQDLKWDKTDPEMGSGSPEITILHVNPDTKTTELLIRGPKNFHVPRHWHTANETLTILRGTFIMKHDGSDERVELNAGSYSYMPAKMVHEAWTGDEGAMYFITVDGAWDINWVK